jgi:hypothetical protein
MRLHPCRFVLRSKDMKKISIGTLLCIFSFTTSAQVKDLRITSDDIILEKLPARIAKPSSSASAAELAQAVRQAIDLSRQTADPRYLGQAQSLIGALWNSPQANYEITTLQATIEQSRHEFAQARKTLQSALTKPAASHAQAQLTLATIERVQGNYAAAEAACKSINTPQAQLYAQTCLLETQSLQGQWSQARQGLTALLRTQRKPGTQAWLLSLLAENEERAGQADAALKYYALSLATEKDGYTALAYSDALLRQNKAALALTALQAEPESDSVLIRRAQAYKLLGDPRHTSLASELTARFRLAAARMQDQSGHTREQALYELHVQGNAQMALALAQSNLKLQREPIDWLLALQSASTAGQSQIKAKLLQEIAQSGLKDERLK